MYIFVMKRNFKNELDNDIDHYYIPCIGRRIVSCG